MRLPEKLALVRKSRGISQASLAEQIGVRQNQYSRWEQGKGRPYADQAFAIAQALGISCDFLLDDDADAPPAPELTLEEREVLGMVRDLGVREARRRLLQAAPSGRAGELVDLTDTVEVRKTGPGLGRGEVG